MTRETLDPSPLPRPELTYEECSVPLPSREFVIAIMAAAVVLLTLLGIASSVWVHFQGLRFYQTVVTFFDLDEENNLPSWYSSISLLFCSGLLLVISCAKRAQLDPLRRYWYGLSAIFALLSLDEMSSMHERTTQILEKLLHGVPYYAWIFVAIPLLAFFGIAYARFLWRIPRKWAIQFVVAGGIYVFAAVVLEVIGMKYYARYGDNLKYHTLANFEEFCEMTGVMLFARALLNYMDAHSIRASLRVGEPDPR